MGTLTFFCIARSTNDGSLVLSGTQIRYAAKQVLSIFSPCVAKTIIFMVLVEGTCNLYLCACKNKSGSI